MDHPRGDLSCGGRRAGERHRHGRGVGQLLRRLRRLPGSAADGGRRRRLHVLRPAVLRLLPLRHGAGARDEGQVARRNPPPHALRQRPRGARRGGEARGGGGAGLRVGRAPQGVAERRPGDLGQALVERLWPWPRAPGTRVRRRNGRRLQLGGAMREAGFAHMSGGSVGILQVCPIGPPDPIHDPNSADAPARPRLAGLERCAPCLHGGREQQTPASQEAGDARARMHVPRSARIFLGVIAAPAQRALLFPPAAVSVS
mmetsp:Transcript_100120/g.280553  ORF Transcript_100120/g.280553 Transcript_100120/m.280553 type:complete len:258 (+) Transcript_100120:1436-2209(+)